jgi:hypothetical protein
VAIKCDELDRLFSLCVRTRAPWCEHCGGRPERLECAHIHGRRHQYLRHDPDNAVALCHACHRHFTERPVIFTRWLEQYEHVGSQMLGILTEKLQVRHKWLVGMKAEARAHYRAELKRLEQERAQGVGGRLHLVGFL